jgi:Spy/CpxP family protein refolding chaperone
VKFSRNLLELTVGPHVNKRDGGGHEVILWLAFLYDYLFHHDPEASRVLDPGPHNQSVAKPGRGMKHYFDLMNHKQISTVVVVRHACQPILDVFRPGSFEISQIIRVIDDTHAVRVFVIDLAFKKAFFLRIGKIFIHSPHHCIESRRQVARRMRPHLLQRLSASRASLCTRPDCCRPFPPSFARFEWIMAQECSTFQYPGNSSFQIGSKSRGIRLSRHIMPSAVSIACPSRTEMLMLINRSERTASKQVREKQDEEELLMRRLTLVALPAALMLVFGGIAITHAAQDVGPAAQSSTPAVGGGSSQSAGSSEEFGGFHHRHFLKAMMEKLGITPDQKKQFRALYVGFADKTRKARMELKGLKDEKKTMLLSGKIDQQKLAQIDDQLVKVKTDLLKEKLKFKRDRLALLTPEQQGKIADWMAEKMFAKKFMKMHGMGGMHGRGMMMHGSCPMMMHGGGMRG